MNTNTMSQVKVNFQTNDDASFKIGFNDNQRYLNNGEIVFPKNSLGYIVDESELITLVKPCGDPYISFKITDTQFADLAAFEEWFAENAVSTGGGSVDPEQLAGLIADAEYVSSATTIYFYNLDGDEVCSIDATAFVKDGMVDNVVISGSNLVITWNTSAGKQPISIPLSSIFNPENYYDKSATDTLLSGKVAVSDYNTYTANTNTALSGKADVSAVTAISDSLSGKQDTLIAGTNIKTLNNESLLGSGNIDIDSPISSCTQAEYDAAEQGGTLDPDMLYIITDASAIDIDNYMTSAQTVSAITEAVSGKADSTLVNAIAGQVATKVAISTYNAYTANTNTTLNSKADTSAVTASINELSAATDTKLATKADTSAVTNPYLFDFWGIANETVEVTDELFEEWIDAFENGRPFFSKNNLESINVDHSEQNYFLFSIYYDEGGSRLAVVKERDYDGMGTGEWFYNVSFETYSSAPAIINRTDLDPSNFTEDTWETIRGAIDIQHPIIMTDDEGGLYPVSVFIEAEEWMFINVRYYHSNVAACSDLMWKIHKIDDGEGNVEFEITDHITDIDSALNSGSTNPVMNSAVTAAVDAVTPCVFDLGRASTVGITDDDWNNVMDAYVNHKPIIGILGSLFYTAESLVLDTDADNHQVFTFTVSDTTSRYILSVTNFGNSQYQITRYDTIALPTTSNMATWSAKQDALISGINIKTINNTSLLGSGNISVSADLTNYYTKTEIDTMIGTAITQLQAI